ncbi:hypothetical protein F5146DRAFT_644560 [Armillaria mellea]|nr:hypothetical protein F5146DRAFT_644560 [Armillaria mellea]
MARRFQDRGRQGYLFSVFIIVVWSKCVNLFVAWAERHVGRSLPDAIRKLGPQFSFKLHLHVVVLSAVFLAAVLPVSRQYTIALHRSPKYVVVMAPMHWYAVPTWVYKRTDDLDEAG